MDPYSPDGELVHMHTAFIQGHFSAVLRDYDPSNFSPSHQLAAQILQHRARCASGHAAAVLESISPAAAAATPDLAAARLLATTIQQPATTAADDAAALAAQHPANATVQLLCATAVARAGHPERGLTLLAPHVGASLDAAALATQLQLVLQRTGGAADEARQARTWAQDALLVNLAESWVGMRRGGDEYQRAFYVFEEMAQGPAEGTASAAALVAQAVAELHLGRLEEGEEALTQALAREPDNSCAVANKIVLDTMVGRDAGPGLERLRGLDGQHALLMEMDAKRDAFRAAMGKYSPTFAQV